MVIIKIFHEFTTGAKPDSTRIFFC